MTDRKKVLYELKHQVADADWCDNDWKDNVPIWLLRDAFAMLKKQEHHGWISVKDRLPEETNQECWVWCPEMGEPEIDTWEGHRGEPGAYYDDADESKPFIKSGWYYNDLYPITHWMPIQTPQPPEEVSGDA